MNAKVVPLLPFLVLFILALLGERLAFSQSTTSTASRLQKADSAVVTKFISGQVAQIGGEEYSGARQIVTGDIDRDGASDLAVLYTIEGVEGGNNYTQYLAVFLRRDGQLHPVDHIAIGGKGSKSVKLESIEDNSIVLATLSYGPDDPMCCP